MLVVFSVCKKFPVELFVLDSFRHRLFYQETIMMFRGQIRRLEKLQILLMGRIFALIWLSIILSVMLREERHGLRFMQNF